MVNQIETSVFLYIFKRLLVNIISFLKIDHYEMYKDIVYKPAIECQCVIIGAMFMATLRASVVARSTINVVAPPSLLATQDSHHRDHV